MQGGHQTQPDQWSNWSHQELVEHIAKYLRAGDAAGLLRVPGKWFTKTHKVFFPDSSSFSNRWPSSSVTALRDNTGLLTRQARCPPLHQANAVSFSVCVQGSFEISAPGFARVWLSLWKSIHSKESVSTQSSTGFQASQHRMSVPRCRFLLARKAVEALKSFVPIESGVCCESSRLVIFLALCRRTSHSASAQNGSWDNLWSSWSCCNREQKTWWLDISWEYVCSGVIDFLGFWMTRCTAAWSLGMVRFSWFSKAWEWRWTYRASAKCRLIKIRSILERVRMIPRAVVSLLV